MHSRPVKSSLIFI